MTNKLVDLEKYLETTTAETIEDLIERVLRITIDEILGFDEIEQVPEFENLSSRGIDNLTRYLLERIMPKLKEEKFI